MTRVEQLSENVTLYLGDCRDVLPTLSGIDAVVTDPPYGLSFMGKKWDYDVPSVEVWRLVLEAIKPGAHLLSFAGTRTQHRMAVNIEDAGFDIRDLIAWVYGSGFPKSLDVSKAIDKAAGAVREVVGTKENSFGRAQGGGDGWDEAIEGGEASNHIFNITAPATEAARQWEGWGTAFKPALEPVTVARKPLVGTVAENVLRYGTGAINIAACRVGTGEDKGVWPMTQRRHNDVAWTVQPVETDTTRGRWPANLIHDGSEEVVDVFPETGPTPGSYETTPRRSVNTYGGGWTGTLKKGHKDSGGSAARFFYCAKASKADRDEGCEGLEARTAGDCTDRTDGSAGLNSPRAGAGRTSGSRNHHPTVKPTALMRYLCRIITPPGGVVLDPFMGSGSTGKAAILEGFGFIGIERDPEYFEIACRRIAAALKSAAPLPAVESPQLAMAI